MILSHFILLVSKCEEWKGEAFFMVGPGQH